MGVDDDRRRALGVQPVGVDDRVARRSARPRRAREPHRSEVLGDELGGRCEHRPACSVSVQMLRDAQELDVVGQALVAVPVEERVDVARARRSWRNGTVRMRQHPPRRLGRRAVKRPGLVGSSRSMAQAGCGLRCRLAVRRRACVGRSALELRERRRRVRAATASFRGSGRSANIASNSSCSMVSSATRRSASCDEAVLVGRQHVHRPGVGLVDDRADLLVDLAATSSE